MGTAAVSVNGFSKRNFVPSEFGKYELKIELTVKVVLNNLRGFPESIVAPALISAAMIVPSRAR